jgi:hypothetical protein
VTHILTNRTLGICLGASVLLLLAACKQSPTSTQQQGGVTPKPPASVGAAADIDACDLLSLGEVTGETGYKLGEPPSSRVSHQCPWPSTDPDTPHMTVLLEASLTDQSADVLISAYRENMSGAGRSVTSVSGIGDKALAVTGEDAGPFAEVYAVQATSGRNAVLRLIIGGESGEPFDASGRVEEAKALTKTAISRLD